MRCGIPNAYILDITMYKMHVSFFPPTSSCSDKAKERNLELQIFDTTVPLHHHNVIWTANGFWTQYLLT